MKKFKLLPKALDSRGIAHFFIPMFIILLVAAVGTYMLVASHADSAAATLALTPPSQTIAVGQNFNVAVVENSGSSATNAVQASFTYDQSKLKFVSVNKTAPFTLVAQTSGDNGTVKMTVGSPGSSITGQQTVATVTFTAIAAVDSSPLSFINSSSIIVQVGTSTNLLTSTTGAKVTAIPVPTKTLATCQITGVPSNPSYGQVITPTAVITADNGTNPYDPTPAYAAIYDTKGNRSAVTNYKLVTPPIAPGKSISVKLPSYTVGFSPTSTVAYKQYQVWWGGAVSETSCAIPFALPLSRLPLYQLYNSKQTDHMYANNATDRDLAILKGGFVLQGTIGYVSTTKITGSVPLYALYSSQSTDHFYTNSENLRASAKASFRKYVDTDIVGYVMTGKSSATTPLYQAWNNVIADHFYTTDEAQKASVLGKGNYVDQGNAGYLFTADH